ncbi:MAG: hypothetical protein H7Z43_14965 [Clostridia bacterium]|nr:hypothetical protein [Deltaproteobacteria bacterium]
MVCPTDYFEAGAAEGKRLFQFEKYAIGVYGIPQALRRVSDSRRNPTIPTFEVVNALLHAAVLRIPSLNELEEELESPEWHKLLGVRARKGRRPFSADTIADVLDGLDVASLNTELATLIQKAERNKAFRDDTYGTFRVAAIDGWEPFCTYCRHCEGCLTRQVKRKNDDGEIETVTQYYHRFVVAFMVAPTLDMVLAIEPVRSADLREDDAPEGRHEGELTTALRLIDTLHERYGGFIDALALDALYACGPVLTKLDQYNYGGFITAKNAKADPLRFAEEHWAVRGTSDGHDDDPAAGESVDYWDLDAIDALKTFSGQVRVLKARVTRTRGTHKGKTTSWAMILTGKARTIGRKTALRTMRARWHIENTAFHQWVTKWNLDHCYRHTPNAITAVILIWSIGFNLMQLFFYRRLKKPRKGRKSTDTIKICVKHMWRDMGALHGSVPWAAWEHDPDPV